MRDISVIVLLDFIIKYVVLPFESEKALLEYCKYKIIK